MNVFVLCTGRCGSLTFTRACQHVTNFTARHESRVALIGDARLAFANNHIEIDNRLAWFLGRLDEAYGDRAYYVHLTRDPEMTARSWARRFHVLGGIAPAYRDNILSGASSRARIGRSEAAADYVRTVTENIAFFLKDKSNVMLFRMEEAEIAFPKFWRWIGAEGNLQAAMQEWNNRHDTEARRTRFKQRVWDMGVRVRRTFFPPP